MDITTNNSLIDPAKAGNLTCEACGTEFTCYANKETCWCSDVEVAPENLTSLRENFNNCLCRECLEKIEVEKAQ